MSFFPFHFFFLWCITIFLEVDLYFKTWICPIQKRCFGNMLYHIFPLEENPARLFIKKPHKSNDDISLLKSFQYLPIFYHRTFRFLSTLL